jgi:hypothetical protein
MGQDSRSGWHIVSESGQYAAQLMLGAPLTLVDGKATAYPFTADEHGLATTLAENLTASTGETCTVVPA